jgi:hypothetical protein
MKKLHKGERGHRARRTEPRARFLPPEVTGARSTFTVAPTADGGGVQLSRPSGGRAVTPEVPSEDMLGMGGFDVQAAIDRGFFKVLESDEDVEPAPAELDPVYGVAMEVYREVFRAREKHAAMNGPHEGYAVILEELDELWDEIKPDRGRDPSARKEAIQIAAMAIRYVLDVIDRR